MSEVEPDLGGNVRARVELTSGWTTILGRRIFLRSLAVTLAATLVALFIEARLLMDSVTTEKQQALTDIAQQMEQPIVRAMWETNNDSVRLILDSIAANPEVIRADANADYILTDIDYEYVREGFGDTPCAWSYYKDYSDQLIDGHRLGSGSVNLCFRNVPASWSTHFVKWVDIDSHLGGDILDRLADHDHSSSLRRQASHSIDWSGEHCWLVQTAA